MKEADGVPSRRDVEALVLSPGPGRPSPDRGSWKAFERFRGEVPVLGVCLGHQTICASYGASVVRRGGPRHGKVTDIRHDGKGILEGVPDPFHAVRYNSLCADPDTLEHPLEVCRRGIYTGSMGIFSAHMTEMSITIRTMVHSGDTYTIGVGSGITYESDPDAEYDETSLKALAMLRSLEG